MGVELLLIFLSVLLLICGGVLLYTSSDNTGHKAGYTMLIMGLIGVFISVIAYPRDKVYHPYYEYSNTPAQNLNTK